MSKIKINNITKYIWLYIVVLGIVASLILYLLNYINISIAIVIILCSVGALIELITIIKDLVHKKIGVDVLAFIAIVASLILSQYAAAAVILLMLTSGNALERFAKSRALREINALVKRVPKKAYVKRGRHFLPISVNKILPDNIILIKPGEVAAVDGIVLTGESSFDESAITGESLPKEKSKGSTVLSGSVNQDVPVEIKALRSSKDSQYEQIIDLVKKAASSQSPIVRLADRYSVPFTLLALFLATVAWYISGDPIRALSVLVVATPCPLIIATPVAIVSAMSRSAKEGIIVKDGSGLENMARLRTIAFDKTGTLTLNTPTIKDITAFGVTKKELITLAASAEQNSTHILASAIVNDAKKNRYKLTKPTTIYESFGNGVDVQIAKSRILVGRLDFLRKNKINVANNQVHNKDTAVYCARNGKVIGSFVFYDPVRKNARSTINKLKRLGIKRFAMLTGDNKNIAESIGKKAGLSNVHAELLPKEKLQIIKSYKNKHYKVAMVGDGVNDAPTLVAADVGIALGAKGSTAASESADVVIMLDDISKVYDAVKIAKSSILIAKQSIFIGIGLSVVLMCFAVVGSIVPLQGALLQEAVDVAVILNALRVLRIKIK